MSLYKQLWLAIALLLILVFGVSLLVTTLSAQAYLEEELAIKNADNATALALSMSQQGADPVLMELALAAQFDTGHYELIELTDPDGNRLMRRVDEQPSYGAPAWFRRLFPIEVEAGVATLQSGWQQAGTLTLRSHSRFAYDELWANTLRLSAVFLLAALAAGIAGGAVLRRILRPLGAVVEQAEAIGERRFITTDEPGTLEFRRLVSAMNALSNRVAQMLGREAQRLQRWQHEASVDHVSGLKAREYFLHDLQAMLERDDASAAGVLALLRLAGLGELNQRFGREAVDNLLADLGSALSHLTGPQGQWVAGRLGGADFALLAPSELESAAVGRAAQDAARVALAQHALLDQLQLPCAATPYGSFDAVDELLRRLDGALLAAQQEGLSAVHVTQPGDLPAQPLRAQLAQWRVILHAALAAGDFSLTRFPVIDRRGAILHREALVRLGRDDRALRAGQFLPWVHRLDLAEELDRQVVRLALAELAVQGQPVAINLSAAALAADGFAPWMRDQLAEAGDAARFLWVEFPEAAAFAYLGPFKQFASCLKACGCRVGIEQFGQRLAELGALHDVGLDYLKVDASLVRGVAGNPANETLLRTLSTLGHAVGVQVIATGVTDMEQWEALRALGLDGATGPGIEPGAGA